MPESPSSSSRHPRFQYRGELAETTLPEILMRISHFGVPGIIEARRGEVLDRVFVRAGRIQHAASSDLRSSLGAHLRRTGQLSQEEFRRVMRQRQTSNKRLGVLLVEQGLLSPGEVHDAIRRQTEEIVWNLFTWTEGEVAFNIGDWKAEDMIPIHLSIRQVILRGIQQRSEVRQLLGRLGGKEVVLTPAYSMENLIELALSGDELALLAAVDGRRTLVDLATSGPGEPGANARSLYAFAVLELVRVAGSPAADSPPPSGSDLT